MLLRSQDLRLASQMMPYVMVPDKLNSNPCNQGYAERENSFRALLSGPQSLLQCDSQEFLNPKLFCTTAKLPVDGSNVTANTAGSGISVISGGLISENPTYRTLENGMNIYPVFSSSAMMSSDCGNNSVGHDGLCSVNSKFQNLELGKAVIHHTLPAEGRVNKISSLVDKWHGTTASSAVKHCSRKILGLQKLPLEAESVFPHNYSALTGGCPRVYCMNTSGYLFISNTGILGIVCSCHFFQMSVSNFCEHSGLRDVSPGDVVRMHTGETIARWRKLYFQKFGIRASGDRSGWDWPEGFSLTAGLMKSGEIMPHISKNSDRVQVVGSSGGFVTSGPRLDNVTFPKNSHTDQNLIIDASHDMQCIKALDDKKILLKGFGSASPINLHSEAHVQVECPTSWCSMQSEFVGSDSNRKHQFTSSQGDSVLKIVNSSIVDPILQTPVKSSHAGRLIHARDGIATDMDAASNIELRLGQPYQQNQPSRNSLLSSFGAQQYETIVDPQKSLLPGKFIHNAISCGHREEFGKYLPSFAGLADIAKRRVQGPSNLVNSETGTSDGLDATKLEKFKGYLAVNSVVPLFTSRAPLEGTVLSTSPKDTVDYGHHRIAKTLCYDSRTIKSGVLNVPWDGDNGSERQLNANVFKIGCFRHPDKVKGVDYVAVSSHAATNVDSRVNEQMGNPMSLTGIAGGNCYPRFSVAHGENHIKNYLSHPENVPSIDSCEYTDHSFLGSMGSPIGSRKFLASEIVVRGNASDVGLIPAVSKQGSTGVFPYVLDENMRLLALGQILELSKQHRVISSLRMDQEHWGVGSSSTVELGHSITRSLTAKEQRHASNITSEQDADVSAVSSKLMQFSATGRLGANGNFECCRNSMSQSKELRNCCSGAPCSPRMYLQCCRYAAHKKCCGANCGSRVGSSHDTFKEHFAYVSDKTSVPVASKFVCEHCVSREKGTYFGQSGKSESQQPESKSCQPQWKDVPSKVKRTCEVTAMERSAAFLGEKGNIDSEVRDTSALCSNEAAALADSLKNREISYLSSECSAPVIHQVITEVNNMDSSVVGEDSGCVNSFVVQESSAIDKCWSSSDGAFESKRTADCNFSNCETNLKEEGSDKVPGNQPSRSLVDELKLMDSLMRKKCQNEMHIGLITHGKSNNLQNNEAALESGKKKRPEKQKTLDSAFCTADLPKAHDRYDGCAETAGSSSSLTRNAQMLPIPDQKMFGACSAQHKSMLGRSFLPLVKSPSRKRDLLNLYDDRNNDSGYKRQLDGRVDFQGIFEVTGNKKFRSDGTCDASGLIWKQSADGDKNAASYPTSGKTESFCESVDVKYRKEMPVVCGKYGEICSRSQATNALKPVKIVSLSRILKTARKFTLPTSSTSRLTSLRDMKKKNFTRKNRRFYELSNFKNDGEIGNHNSIVSDTSLEASGKERGRECSSGDRQITDKFFTVDKDRVDKSKKYCDVTDSQSKPCKEIRKRSLYELSLRGDDSSEMPSHKKVARAFRKERSKHLRNAEDRKSCLVGTSKFKMKRSAQEHKHIPLRNSDAFCCVCGSSNEDEVNCLVECSQCLIRVHRACYGISRVPKSRWYCRPCRKSSENIVCVLCGYGGGAMTQAVRSRAIVKSLLKAWNIETEPMKRNCLKEMSQDGLNLFHLSGYLVENDSYPVLRPVNIEPGTTILRKIDMQKQLDIGPNSLGSVNNLKVHNSITSGVFDSAVKQWVHMVCGLWTPGTRCPNVDTMSTFDVSGAAHCNAMCSICNRPGGSCIQCRVVNCSVQFHPWCAHQEGLLQIEVEGIHNENVGFYGSCVLHARPSMWESVSDITNNEADCPSEKEPNCARTEGYRGRKRDGFWHNPYKKGAGGCIVPQEQLDAWTHINKLKSCMQGLIKPPVSDIEYDCRKEYDRYKHAKGWKHLVVYKSGIHALGLYTSWFISRGEMVVEYVGEVVGVRVADKRENEYQSGRRLQYKSACYFFRIDKEHIIDATKKGGVARFVNHSCLPNCIAKVISVKTGRKVVFFADRDILPGEEITYDYHFNHEDEGKKIPCFCNSKNCRRYLN